MNRDTAGFVGNIPEHYDRGLGLVRTGQLLDEGEAPPGAA